MSLEIPGYAVGDVLAEGAFGVVLQARSAQGMPALVKVARADHPEARALLAREAEALRSIGPPAAPALLSAGVTGAGDTYLVLERVGGVPLDELLRATGGKLAPAELRRVALGLTAAVAMLHRRGWAHGDLKPSHVFVDGTAARLVDFGLAARVTRRCAGEAGAPHAAGFAGTPAYMAPEQCHGASPIPASDVYAAGAVLFEALTGRPPFRGTPAELHQAHLAAVPPRPSTLAPVAPPLEDVLLRCLAKDPAARYADADALRDALLAALLAAPAPEAQPARARVPPAGARRAVALARFESGADLLAVTRAIEGAGGRVGVSSGTRHVAVFEPGARDNAVRRALDGAAALAAAGVAARAVVDLATVTVIDVGAVRRYVGKLDAPGGAPDPSDPPGVLLTPAAAAAVPDLPLAPAGRGDLRRVGSRDGEDPSATAPPLVGREPVLGALARDAAAALAARAPAVVSVVGEAGVGKSRLARELAARLRALGGPGAGGAGARHFAGAPSEGGAPASSPDVVLLRGEEGAAGGDATLRALLGWAVPGAAEPAPDSPRARLAAALPPEAGPGAWAPVALALGWIGASDPALAPWRAAPGALRAAVVRAAGESIRARAAARPACLLLDDAHLADSAALDALEYAALAEARVPLFVAALGRPALAAARPSLGDRAASTARVELGALDDAAAAELARALLAPAEGVPASAVATLLARTHGVPVLLVELVRGLRERGLVRQREDGTAYVATDELDRVPDLPLVEWLADRELSALPAGLAAHARLVALLGDAVRLEDVSSIAAQLDRDAPGTLALDAGWATLRLVEERVLSARDGRVSFRQPVLREAIARAAPEAFRRAVHRAAGRFYATAPGLPGLERLARRAKHAAESGLADAAALARRLADALAARHAYLEAESAFTRALSLLPPDDRAARLGALRGRGAMRYRLGRAEDAIADLAEGRGLSAALGDRGAELDLLLDEATALDWMNDWSASAARLAEAERLAAGAAEGLAAARLALARGRTLFRAARFADAAVAMDEAAGRAAALGHAGYETHVIALLIAGFVLPDLGRPDDAEAALARAHALASARGDLLHVAAALNNRRNLWIARGDVARAVEDQEGFLRIGREIGMIGIEYAGQFNLGELRYQLGDAGAERHVERAADIERRHPAMAPKPLAPLLAARIRAHRGDLEAAAAALDAVRARERDGGERARLGPSDRILADAVGLAVTLAPEEAWRALRARSSRESVEQEPIEIAELHALTAQRAGRREDATRAIAEALQLSREIPNAMGRRLARTMESVRRG